MAGSELQARYSTVDGFCNRELERYGDAELYTKQIETLRRSIQDIAKEDREAQGMTVDSQ